MSNANENALEVEVVLGKRYVMLANFYKDANNGE